MRSVKDKSHYPPPFDALCWLLSYGYSYKASCTRPGKAVICNF